MRKMSKAAHSFGPRRNRILFEVTLYWCGVCRNSQIQKNGGRVPHETCYEALEVKVVFELKRQMRVDRGNKWGLSILSQQIKRGRTKAQRGSMK